MELSTLVKENSIIQSQKISESTKRTCDLPLQKTFCRGRSWTTMSTGFQLKALFFGMSLTVIGTIVLIAGTVCHESRFSSEACKKIYIVGFSTVSVGILVIGSIITKALSNLNF